MEKKWIGKRISHKAEHSLLPNFGTVMAVCDDGAQCDHDARRKFKPTGSLVVHFDGCTIEHYPLACNCKIV